MTTGITRLLRENKVLTRNTISQNYLILQAEYCNADCTTWKLTLQDINATPKELKTERDCSHRQLFRPFWGSSVWRNNQRKLWRKISAHSDFKPWPRTSRSNYDEQNNAAKKLDPTPGFLRKRVLDPIALWEISDSVYEVVRVACLSRSWFI